MSDEEDEIMKRAYKIANLYGIIPGQAHNVLIDFSESEKKPPGLESDIVILDRMLRERGDASDADEYTMRGFFGKLQPAGRLDFISELLRDDVEDGPFITKEQALDLLGHESNQAQERIATEIASGEGAIPFHEAMAAWMPEKGSAYFGTDRQPPGSVIRFKTPPKRSTWARLRDSWVAFVSEWRGER